MPIKPENRARYPKNWKHIVAQIRERSGNKCEGSPAYPDCRRPNGALFNKTTGEITTDGALAEAWELADGDKVVKIVLTTAHLDHVPENCDGMEHGGPLLPVEQSNLRHWCQRCHLNYDADHHRKSSGETRRQRKNNLELFEAQP